jgi:hypothetical protein
MLISRRNFERREPFKDAKSIYIFCEGKRTEYEYFKYFEYFDSRIKLVIYELDSNEDNSPRGLYNIACDCLLITEENSNPQYELIEGLDEVWFVFDKDKDKMDSRETQIHFLKSACLKKKWNLSESNPCFEVWLYYHIFNNKPMFEGIEISSNWKPFLNSQLKGGFDPRKHPIYIETAIKNTKRNFESQNDRPTIGSSEVYKLAEIIYPFIKERLLEEQKKMK